MASWPRFLVLFRKRYLKRYFAIITLLGSLSCIFLHIRYTLSETFNFSSKSFPNNILKYEEAEGGISFSVQNFPTVHTNHGMMNEHVWWNISETAMDALRNWPHFANVPNKRSFITDFHSRTVNDSTNKGLRIFGFIHPQVDGKYTFAITSSGPSELWLSPNEHPACSQLIARVYSPDEWASTLKEEYNKYHGQISCEISLYAGKKYYMESLAVNRQSSDETFVTVHWLNTSASKNSNFRIILSKYLSPFNGTNSLERSPRRCNSGTESNLQERFLRLPLMNRMEYMTLFPTCRYNPSFLVRRKLERYQGVWLTMGKESLVFPQDDTDMSSKEQVKKWASPNPVINKNRVECIVNEFMSILRRNDIVLKNINNVIQKPDAENGNRFLLDLEVALNCTDQTFRLTEHVYQKKESGSLCLPEGMIWNNNATIYFIIPVKEQGKWIHHFIKQVTTASVLTGDTNFHVIIADFESKDINIKEAFNTSLLNRRHTVVQLRTGKFYKTLALNKAVEVVPNAHDIVFLFDLHIDVPINIMDTIRKNTIAGRMVYFPIVGRLNCNSDSKEHRGFWQMNGFGLMAMYKSDWTKLGGMNTSAYQYKWGGEDWDLIDRVLMMSLEVERIKHPGLYHHCHPRQGMWS